MTMGGEQPDGDDGMMPPPAFVGPREVSDASSIEEICRLRATVWRKTGDISDRAFADGRWRDAFDDVSRHWVVTRNDEIVAAARLSLHDRLAQVPEADEYLAAGMRLDGVIAAPARVVVCPSARRRGLAGELLDAQEQAALRAGATHAVRQASPAMCRLLGRRGWRHVGAAKSDARFPNVTFQIMVSDLKATGAD